MNATDLTLAISEALAIQSDECEGLDNVRSVRTFEDEGVMTNDAGLVITLDDGSEFQLTIVQSMVAR